jgi:polysaccharide export outer membrane protein
MRFVWGVLLSALLFNSCYQKPNYSRPEAAPVRALSVREASLQNDAQDRRDWLQRLMQTPFPAHRIQAGDAFNLSVYGEPELDSKGIVVTPEGLLTIPLVGPLPVAGMSLAEAKAVAEQALGRYIKQPQLSLMPYAFAGRSFTLLGKVNRPGAYALGGPTRLIEGLAKAEGFSVGIIKNDSTELANFRDAFMVREGVILPVDFEALITRGDMQHNIPLLPGDYIYVPSVAQQEVYVLGEVYEQNSFAWRQGMTLTQALAYAKGIKDDTQLAHLYLVRGRLHTPQLYVLNLAAILQGQEPDVLLESGDVVYVLATPTKDLRQLMSFLLPSLQAIQTGTLMYEVIRNLQAPAAGP